MKRITKTKLRTPIAFTNISKNFTAYGKSFFDITNVYLSGLPFQQQSSTYNVFSNSSRLSALYPPIFALKLSPSAYNVENENIISFSMPGPTNVGFIDLIVENEAGYGSVTRYVKRSTYNPYISGTQEYEAYEPYIRPWSQGIQVFTDIEYRYLVTIENDNILLTTIENSYDIVRI